MKYNIFAIAALAVCSLPLGACSDDNAPAENGDRLASDLYFAPTEAKKQDLFYKPAVGYVGDPMPFFDPVAKDFKILYLQDYRPNQAVTYHPIWAVSTKDGASYTSLGELVSCGAANELDAALGTGSAFYHDGTYHIFYTAHSPNASTTAGITEAVMVATSKDFKTWTKDRSFMLTAGDKYSNVDFRDPYVFTGEDGLFHMLVSTRLNGKGVIAEYTSSDLRDWSNSGEFMTMMWDRFYECPDLFRMGDWWYLVYSEQHDAVRKVQYFKGRTIDELRASTANDAGLWPDDHEGFLDSRGFYAGKTASDGQDRFIWGWCATKAGQSNSGNPDWGGNLVMHKLIQHADGTLTLGEAPAIAALFPNAKAEADFNLTGFEHKLFPRLGTENRLSFTVTASSADDRFGISFGRGSDSVAYPTLIVNPEGSDRRKINFEEEGGAGFISGGDGYLFNTPADNVYNITVVTDNSVVTLYINDCAAYTGRVYGTQKNPWSINCYDGSISVSNIKVASK